MMKTIQITIDQDLLQNVDQVVQELGETRSAFVRQALEQALRQWQIHKLELQHATGYARHPVAPGEFDDWESEQHWGEA
ncbi:MAG TPA: ribbon-helix-helix domain-containing protein [Caldilineaceae bacterium]|nr:ribbon-helix-helix domain-containing protein [Caldilineaceae bacterium]